MADTLKKRPSLVRVHHRMRSVSFVVTFAITALHIWDRHPGVALWALLAAIFLVYPHVQYWRASRSSRQVAVVLNSLLLDSAALGFAMAAVQFPLWITVAVMVATLTNSASNKDWWGVGQSAIAALAGMLSAVILFGFNWSPGTDGAVTLFSIVGLTGYILALGNIGYNRNVQLREIRAQLQNREQELIAANEALHHNLQEIQGLHEQLRDQANRDALTGLHNRRFLDSTLEREAARCEREGQVLALIMLDVDHFKMYNDQYGHQAGDACLQFIARTLMVNIKRASDLVARYGGEEFVLVLPDTELGSAQQMAEAMRQAVESLRIPHAQSPFGQVTISLGVAAKSSHRRDTIEGLIQAADEALYRAKQGGRNQVQAAACAEDAARTGGAGFVRLVWSAAYDCGHPLIDEQHRALFALANRLLAAILAGETQERIGGLVDALLECVEGHFRDEERLYSASAYPRSVEHTSSHRNLLDHARQMVERFRAGEGLGIGELFQFFAQELVAHHFLGADREFFPFLEAGRAP